MRKYNRLLYRFDHPRWAMGSGILLALSLPPLGLYPLAWVALVPLLVRWSYERPGWSLLREAYAAFLLTSSIMGFWVLFHEFTLTALLSGLGLLLLPLPFAVAVLAAGFIRARFGLGAGLLAFVSFLLTAEFLLMHGPFAVPWLLLGHTQADALPFNQIADLGGVGLLSLWVLLLNVVALLGIRTVVRPGLLPGPRSLAALTFVIVAMAPSAYGDWRRPEIARAGDRLEVAVVQPAVPSSQWADFTDGLRVERLARLSDEFLAPGGHPRTARAVAQEAGGRPDLLVWPESSLPIFDDAERQRRLYARLSVWSAQRGVPLLTGAITRYDSAPAPTAAPYEARATGSVTPYFNSALLFTPRTAPQQYDKVHPLPLVETIPFTRSSPLLRRLGPPAGGSPAYGTGRGPASFEVGSFRVGTVIGSETLHGDHVRRLAPDADLLVALVQNGWWGHSPGIAQHLRLSRLRAIEIRRALIVAADNGASSLILPDGTVKWSAGWMEEGLFRLRAPVLHTPTVYAAHGDWVGRGSGLLSGGLVLMWLGALVFFRPPVPQTARGKKRPMLVPA
ncbi:MAG TPA: apolipoprotein N-acyltransferase [Rubricoccaceae bacterium]|nr:apolipoprotein N-acyltransferase [Rubricoccaceae bacterium]